MYSFVLFLNGFSFAADGTIQFSKLNVVDDVHGEACSDAFGKSITGGFRLACCNFEANGQVRYEHNLGLNKLDGDGTWTHCILSSETLRLLGRKLGFCVSRNNVVRT